MNTFQDMRNEILRLYKESLNNYPLPDNEEDFYRNVSDEEFPPGDLDRKVYIAESIMNLDSSVKDDLLLLLSLYYYFYNIYEDPEDSKLIKIENAVMEAFEMEEEIIDDEIEDEDELLNLIEDCNKDALLDAISDQESDYLYDLLDVILDEDIKLYSEETINRGYIKDNEQYLLICQNLEKENVRKIFSCYHPNLLAEENAYNEYQRKEYYYEKFSDINASSLKDFIEKFLVAKQSFKDDYYLYSFLISFLKTIKDSNKQIYNEICIFILKYYYIRKYLDENNIMNLIKKDVVWQVQELSIIDECVLREFLKFDFNSFTVEFNMLPKEVIEEFTDLISLENTKSYGEEGIWEEYNSIIHDKKIFKYTPYFDTYVKLNNKDKKYIYFTKDKNGDYNIPRICLIVDDNNVKSIIGRGIDRSVELELLDILLSKLSEYKKDEIALKKIANLNNIKKIYDKIKQGIELNCDEINYLYCIDNILSCFDTDLINISKEKNKEDLTFESEIIRNVREFSNAKKDLSRYFGCSENEVATTTEELNENTVVTTIFCPKEDICFYPKLRVILNTAWADSIKSAQGLESLEYIKDSANFEQLVSSEGLEKLKYIGGDAIFTNMKDLSHFNPQLVIKGNVYFEYGDDPKIKIFKK